MRAKFEKRSVPMSAQSIVSAWQVVLVTTAAQMVVSMSNLLIPTIAPKVAESLGVDPVLVGYQVGLTFGAATIASIYSSILVMRWGAAATTQISMLCSLTGLALLAVPQTGWVALGSIAVGAGMGCASPAAAHLIVRHTPSERRNLVFGIKQTGVPLGGVIVSLTAPALAVTVGWQWALVFIGAFAVATFLLAGRSRAAWDADRQPAGSVKIEPFGGVPLLWSQESLRWVALAAMMFSGIQRILVSFTVVYVVAECGYGLVEAGVLLSLAQAGGSLSRIPWGWVADRVRSGLAVLTLLCLAMIVFSTILVFLEADWPRPAVYALFLALGASCLGWNGLVHAECARLAPAGAISLVAGGASFFIFGGVVVGPPLFSAAYGVIGTYSATLWLMVALSVAALGLLALAYRGARAR
jgi:predicted MFS family arabinose efflux permease